MNLFKKAALLKKLKKDAKSEIRISYKLPEDDIPVCASKIGGKPAVPQDFVWPEYTGEEYGGETKSRPLSFMAQINLKDVAPHDNEGLLPKTGVLSFFYEMVTMKWGFDPDDKGCARVFYFPDECALAPVDLPESIDEDVIVPELEIDFKKHISIPVDKYVYSDDYEYEDCEECFEEIGYEPDDMGDVTKLLGYPDVIQNPMEEECETVTRGYYQGGPEDSKKISQAEKDDIKEKASQWTLLFQMGTVEADEKEIMFGDCGHIYFWIKKSDLAEHNFDNIWLILQCG